MIAEPPETTDVDLANSKILAERPGTTARIHGIDGDLRGIASLLDRFDPISLSEMEGVALQDRVDTKYVLGTGQLLAVLAAMTRDYQILQIGDSRLSRYRTLYFDTDDFALFRQHHAGKPIRCKIRSREYVETGQSFLEIKWKGKRERTVKTRVRTPGFVTRWEPGHGCLPALKAPIDETELAPKLANQFTRVTLVGRHYRERVTVDLGLRYSGNGGSAGLSGIAVVEAKQDGLNRNSAFLRQMRAAGIRPCGFSKYCIGVSLLYDEVKHNRFNPQLRLICALMGGNRDA